MSQCDARACLHACMCDEHMRFIEKKITSLNLRETVRERERGNCTENFQCSIQRRIIEHERERERNSGSRHYVVINTLYVNDFHIKSHLMILSFA